MARNLDPRNRTQVITVSAFSGVLLMSLYPLFAVYKGELLPGRGHNSLLETAYWQLVERHKSGSVLDPSSATHQLLATWLSYDWILLVAGVAALPLVAVARELRPLGLLLVIEWVVLILGGYVPAMHVITLLPMSALLAVAAVERLSRRGWVPAVAAVAAAAVWAPALWPMMSMREQPPLLSATRWVADNVPRDKVLVVHDSIWVDLTYHYGFRPRPVIAYKLDTDPAVVRTVRHVDYLVVPNWYYRSPDAFRYPTFSRRAITRSPWRRSGRGTRGRELSDLVGGREFVIDTSRNGLGPPPGDAWCNPPRQALGGPPKADPGLAGLAAYLWIKRPGESDGVCGGETTWEFSPRQARILISQK